MKLEAGQKLPDSTFLVFVGDDIKPVSMAELTAGKTLVLFGLPGAYTGTCSTAHIPSFVRTADQFRAKGVDTIACVSVNDPAVMRAWGAASGASAAGILMLSDADGSYTKSVGMNYDAPERGMFGRSQRYSLLARNGVVELFNYEEQRGTCNLSSGESMLDQF